MTNQALKQALELSSCLTQLSGLEDILIVFQILDRVTGLQTNIRQVIVGIKINLIDNKEVSLLRDWELLKILNQSFEKMDRIPISKLPSIDVKHISKLLQEAENYLTNQLKYLDLPFQVPKLQVNALFYPAQKVFS